MLSALWGEPGHPFPHHQSSIFYISDGQVYMTGGSGYAMSREAARIFVAGHSASGKCRPGNVGPEDVEMSRCLQRLGVNFIDTRDKYGR